jgi:hypothetical protein
VIWNRVARRSLRNGTTPRSLSDLGPSSRDGGRPRPDWRECEAHSGHYVTSSRANLDRRPLRDAIPAPRKPGVTIALRCPCSAQARGVHPWPPAQRMRCAPGHPRDACVAPVVADGPKSDRLLERDILRAFNQRRNRQCGYSHRSIPRTREFAPLDTAHRPPRPKISPSPRYEATASRRNIDPVAQ